MSEQDDNRQAQSEALGRALSEAMDGDLLHPAAEDQPLCAKCGKPMDLRTQNLTIDTVRKQSFHAACWESCEAAPGPPRPTYFGPCPKCGIMLGFGHLPEQCTGEAQGEAPQPRNELLERALNLAHEWSAKFPLGGAMDTIAASQVHAAIEELRSARVETWYGQIRAESVEQGCPANTPGHSYVAGDTSNAKA